MRSVHIPLAIAMLALGGGLPLSMVAQAQTAPAIQDKDLTPYQQALLNYQLGKYDEARTAIDAADKAKPGDPNTELLKARILTEQGDYAEGAKILQGLLASKGTVEVQLALGDLLLRKHDFNGAAKSYNLALQAKPNDPDISLKLIYAKVGNSDLTSAEKDASKLKPMDPDHPSYYFAKAALAQATGKTSDAEDDIQTVRTIYGITVANHYLKTYLEVFASAGKDPSTVLTPPISTNGAPVSAKP